MKRSNLTRVILVTIFAGFITFSNARAGDVSTGKVYSIISGKKGKFLAVGSDGNVLLWTATNKNDQKWELIHYGENKFNIRSKKGDKYFS